MAWKPLLQNQLKASFWFREMQLMLSKVLVTLFFMFTETACFVFSYTWVQYFNGKYLRLSF